MAGVVQREPDLDGAGRRVEVRLDELDLARERLARERLDARLDRLPHADQAQLVLVDLRLDPDGVEVGDLEHRVARLHLLPLDDVLLEDVPADRREDRDREVGLALLEDLVDLGLGDPPPLELLGRRADHLLPVGRERPADGRLRLAPTRPARRAALSSSWIACDSSGLYSSARVWPTSTSWPVTLTWSFSTRVLPGTLAMMLAIRRSSNAT